MSSTNEQSDEKTDTQIIAPVEVKEFIYWEGRNLNLEATRTLYSLPG